MKNIIITILLATLIAGALLSAHIIRTTDGFEFTTKEQLTFQDTYVDVRQWGLKDYFSHSPKIRNYLLEKKYEAAVNLVKGKEKTFKEKAGEVVDSVGQKVKDLISD
ncbi:hypothetical protein QUF80_06075 [Desulfococcaceae bacterium HSG8]|nr:hypothetical protein [Desulfococcaceae bacterium HSG8]